MGFPRREYWSGLPFPSPGDLVHPEIESWSPALQACSLPLEPPGAQAYRDAKNHWTVCFKWHCALNSGHPWCPAIKNPWANIVGGHGFDLWSRKLPYPVGQLSCLVAQMVKNLLANAGDPGLIPGLGRSPGEGNGYPLSYSCLENSMDRGARWATVHGVTNSQTRLSHFHFTGHLSLCATTTEPMHPSAHALQ